MEPIAGNAGAADQPAENRFEATLYDILDQVFSYLNAKDLSYASRVSTTWRDTAEREFAKRGPEAVILRHAYACEDQFDYSTDDEEEVNRIRRHENRSHVSNFIRSRPEIGLFFADDSLVGYRDPWSHIEWHFMEQFSYPISIIVFEVLSACVNATEAIGTNHLTASLLLPPAQGVNVEVLFVDAKDMKKHQKNGEYTHEIVEQLFPEEQENTCILVFHGPGFEYNAQSEALVSQYHSEFLHHLETKRKLKNFGLWGTRVTSLKTKGGDPDHPIPWVGVTISGPSVRSWALILDCNLIDADIEEKLLAFKKDIKLRASAVAILLVPSTEKATREQKLARMDVFKRIFPIVHLTIFSHRSHPVFSLSATSTETDQEISHMNSISYFILSYGSF